MDTDVIEVKGSAPTVTVSWKKKNDEERESDDLEKTNCESDQMAVKETMACGEAITTELLLIIKEQAAGVYIWVLTPQIYFSFKRRLHPKHSEPIAGPKAAKDDESSQHLQSLTG